MRRHCPPDTGFEIRACYLSVTEAPHNIESLQVSEIKTFCFFGTWEGWSVVRTRDFRLSTQAALTTAPGPPPELYSVTYDCFY